MWRRRKGEEGVVASPWVHYRERECRVLGFSVPWKGWRHPTRQRDSRGRVMDANKSEHRLLFAKSVDTFCAVDGYSGWISKVEPPLERVRCSRICYSRKGLSKYTHSRREIIFFRLLVNFWKNFPWNLSITIVVTKYECCTFTTKKMLDSNQLGRVRWNTWSVIRNSFAKEEKEKGPEWVSHKIRKKKPSIPRPWFQTLCTYIRPRISTSQFLNDRIDTKKL